MNCVYGVNIQSVLNIGVFGYCVCVCMCVCLLNVDDGDSCRFFVSRFFWLIYSDAEQNALYSIGYID